MKKVLFLVLVVGVAGLTWLAYEFPTPLTVAWQDYQVETDASILLVGIIVFFLGLRFLEGTLRFLFNQPRFWVTWMRGRKNAKFSSQLLEFLVHWEGKAFGQAERILKKIATPLEQNPLIRFLLKRYDSDIPLDDTLPGSLIARHPKAEFLNVKHRLEQDLLDQNPKQAIQFLEELVQKGNRLPWVFETLHQLYLGHHHFEQAHNVLEMFKRQFSKPQIQSYKATILYAQAMLDETTASQRDSLLCKAYGLCPKQESIALDYAEFLAQQNQGAKARAILEATWQHAPSIDLVEAYLRVSTQETPLQRAEACQNHLKKSPPHPLNHLLLGRVALDAELWTTARNAFEALQKTHPELAYPLLASLEKRQHQDLEKANRWLERYVQLGTRA